MNQGRTRCVTYLTCLITVTANLAVKWSGLWGSMSTYRYWRCVIFILAMFHFQVLWHRLRKPELVPLARKVNSWNCYGILCIFNMVVVHEQVCWGIALIWMWMWILHVLCGLLSRMQCNRFFYAGCESRRWAVLMNASWVDKPFRLPQYNEDLWDSHAS